MCVNNINSCFHIIYNMSAAFIKYPYKTAFLVFSRQMHSHSRTFIYNTGVEHNKPIYQPARVRPAYNITSIYPIPTTINIDSINSPYFHHIYNKKTRMTIILDLYNNLYTH